MCGVFVHAHEWCLCVCMCGVCMYMCMFVCNRNSSIYLHFVEDISFIVSS